MQCSVVVISITSHGALKASSFSSRRGQIFVLLLLTFRSLNPPRKKNTFVYWNVNLLVLKNRFIYLYMEHKFVRRSSRSAYHKVLIYGFSAWTFWWVIYKFSNVFQKRKHNFQNSFSSFISNIKIRNYILFSFLQT